MSIKLLRTGTWWLSSKSDPRWNSSGCAEVGGFVMPKEAQEQIERKTKELGAPPKDLEWGYMKD